MATDQTPSGHGVEADAPLSLMRRFALTSVGVWGSAAISVFGTLIAARALGPHDYGLVVLAIATAVLVSTLLDVTLEPGIVYHGSRLLQAGDLAGLRGLLAGAAALDLAIGLLVCSTLFAFAAPIADLAGSGYLDASIMQIAAFYVLGSTMDGTVGGTLLIADRPQVRGYAMAGTNLMRVAGVGVAVAMDPTATSIMAAYAVATCVGGVFQLGLAWYFGWRLWPAPISHAEARASARKLLPFAVHFSIATTLLSATDVVIVLLLGHFSGPDAAAIFKVATLPIMVGALASVPIRLVMTNEQAKLVAARRYAEFKALLLRWSTIGAAIAVPAGVAGWFVMPWLLPLAYGDAFAGAVDSARILLIYACIFFAFSWTKSFPTVIGRPRLATGLSVLLLVVAVPITVIWSDSGPEAAALGVTLGAGLVSLANVVVAIRLRPRDDAPAASDAVAVTTRTPQVPTLEKA